MRVFALVLLSLVLLSAVMACAQQIPPGTALPITLNSTIDSNKLQAGQKIFASVAQDVPLPSHGKIRSGSRVSGQVLQVGDKPGSGAFVRLRFDQVQINGRDIPIVTSSRALASPWEVQEAQTPKISPVGRDPGSSWVTTQIGDDVVYRGGGHVMHGEKVVGDPVKDGVLAVLTAQPGCDYASGERRLALWVFSSTACGAYGFRWLQVSQTGNAEPVGEIVLQSKKNVRLETGTALLLVTVEAAQASSPPLGSK